MSEKCRNKNSSNNNSDGALISSSTDGGKNRLCRYGRRVHNLTAINLLTNNLRECDINNYCVNYNQSNLRRLLIFLTSEAYFPHFVFFQLGLFTLPVELRHFFILHFPFLSSSSSSFLHC